MTSVNNAIDPKLCSVKCTLFDAAVAMVAKLSKEESVTLSAFCMLPMHPTLISRVPFILIRLCPMDCSISCSAFEWFSSVLEYACEPKLAVAILHIVQMMFYFQEEETLVNFCLFYLIALS